MSVHVRPEEPQLDAVVLDAIARRLVDPLAKRVVEMMKEEGVLSPSTAEKMWLSAAEVARRLRVRREWVYEHAAELGAVRIGEGPRPRLRFPLDVTRLERSPTRQPPTETNRVSDGRARGLLPIYDG